MADAEARWADLERRVAALEEAAQTGSQTGSAARVQQASKGVAPETSLDPETFWVLEGLRPQASGSGAVVYAGTVRTAAGPVDWQYAHTADDLLAGDQGDLAPLASRLAALGHPARLAILTAVLTGHDRTTDLADHLDLGTSGQVYHHVKALTAAGWLRPAARGHLVVPPERVVPLLVAMGASS